MREKERIFIASNFSEELISKIDAFERKIQSELSIPGIRWVKSSNLHLTLQFIGDVEKYKIPEISNLLDCAVIGKGPITVSVKGFGCFSNRQNPKVLWIGIEENAELLELVKPLSQTLAAKNYIQPGLFSPHITLARIKDFLTDSERKLLNQIQEKNKSVDLGRHVLNNVTLFQSFLSKVGPTYIPIHQARL